MGGAPPPPLGFAPQGGPEAAFFGVPPGPPAGGPPEDQRPGRGRGLRPLCRTAQLPTPAWEVRRADRKAATAPARVLAHPSWTPWSERDPRFGHVVHSARWRLTSLRLFGPAPVQEPRGVGGSERIWTHSPPARACRGHLVTGPDGSGPHRGPGGRAGPEGGPTPRGVGAPTRTPGRGADRTTPVGVLPGVPGVPPGTVAPGGVPGTPNGGPGVPPGVCGSPPATHPDAGRGGTPRTPRPTPHPPDWAGVPGGAPGTPGGRPGQPRVHIFLGI